MFTEEPIDLPVVEETGYHEIYDIFFNKIQQDERFFFNNILSPEESMEIALEMSKFYLDEALYQITMTGSEDCEIELVEFQNDIGEKFTIKLTSIEKQLISDIMVEKHLDRSVIDRINALSRMYYDTDMKVFAPANELKAFDDAVDKIRRRNTAKILSYKNRDRESYKYKHFDYTVLS